MALQIWLPGTSGTLLNQGLYKLPNTSYNSMSEFTLGKLGKAIKGNAMYHLSSDIFGNKWSVACWIKFISGYSQYNNIILCLNTSDSEDSKFYLSIVNNTYLNIGRGSSSGVTYTLSGGFIVDTWYHVAATCDGTKTSLYLNGNLVNSGNVGSVKSALNLGIGCRSTNNAGTNITGFSWPMNDIRIYDHCLNPKEVKELSKGLVLHYKLDNTYNESTTNLATYSTIYSNVTYGSPFSISGWGGDTGTCTCYKTGGYNNGPYKVYHKTSTGSGGIYWKAANDIHIVAGKTYTFSVYIKASREYTDSSYSFNINRGSDNTYITYNQAVHFTTEWKRIEKTFTATNSQAGDYGEMSIIYNDDVSDYYVYYSCFQIEEKDHATPFANTSRSETTVFDSSGYGYDGTITGSLAVASDTSRHKACTNFPNSECAITIGNLSTMVPDGVFTFNIWMKKVTGGWSSKGYETILGGPSGFELEAKNAATNAPSLVLWNWGKGSITYELDKWNMVTFVRTASDTKLYLNGVLGATGTAGSIPSGNYFIGAWATAAQQNYRGYFSDARIYATVLSDNDIKELYDTSAYVYNNGTVAAYEFIEDETSPEVKKTGIAESENFSEYSDNTKILSDGSVWVRLLHHNQPSAYLFTQNNCWNNNDENLFSALGLLKNNTWANSNGEYEFMICEKTTSEATEGVYRWKQTSNPATTSTVTGYSVISGSPAHPLSLRNTGSHGCFHNGAVWWVCCGSWQQEGGGVPGVAGYVTTGYLDLYVRVPNLKMLNEANAMFHKNNIQTNQLIEI